MISKYYENYQANKTDSKRNEKHISCSMRTLYRVFKRSIKLDITSLPMKGKRHPNGYVERRVKAGRLGRSISDRYKEYLNYHNELDILKPIRSKAKSIKGQ